MRATDNKAMKTVTFFMGDGVCITLNQFDGFHSDSGIDERSRL